MTRDDMVRSAALPLAAVMALRPRALGDVRVLVPLDPKRPTAHAKQGWLLYRIRSIAALDYFATLSARLMLVVLLFPLWLLLLNAVVPDPNARDLAMFLYKTNGWFLCIALAAGGIATFYLIPFLLVFVLGWYASDWANYPREAVATIAFAVVLPGRLVGGTLSWNLCTLLHELRLELRRGHTRDGEKLGAWSRIAKRVQFAILWTTPLMVLYEVVRFFRPEINLAGYADALRPYDPRRYALLLASLAIGYNVLLNVLPLYREMLERASIGAAGGFELLLKKRDERISAGTPVDEQHEEFIKNHFNEKGEWRQYGPTQRLPILMVVLTLAISGLTQTIEKLTDADLAAPDPRLATFIRIVAWFMLVVNIWFLWVFTKSRVEVWLGKQRIAERTLETVWRSVREPDLIVTFRHDRGVEPADAWDADPDRRPRRQASAPAPRAM